MKQADITKGGRYTNGKGAIREVLRVSTPVSWSSYKVVKYLLVEQGNSRSQNVNGVYGCVLLQFARWATEEIRHGGEG